MLGVNMNNFSKKLLCLAILGFSATIYAAPGGGAGNGAQGYQYNNPNYTNSGIPSTGNVQNNPFSGKYNTDPNYAFNPGGNNPNDGWDKHGNGSGKMGPGDGRGPGRGAGQGCPNSHSRVNRGLDCSHEPPQSPPELSVTSYNYHNVPVINTGWISRVGGDPDYAADTDGGEANLGGAHFHDMSGEGEDLTAARESAPAFRLLVGVIGGGVNIAQANASK
jgi:hypothetical protein